MSFRALWILAALAILSAPALAQDYNQLPPVGGSTQPLRPMVPNYQYQLPSVPQVQVPNHDPWGVADPNRFRPAPQRHWRDMVDDATRQFTKPAQIQRQFERMDNADQRRIYGRCAKYSIHCANMLRSLGGK